MMIICKQANLFICQYFHASIKLIHRIKKYCFGDYLQGATIARIKSGGLHSVSVCMDKPMLWVGK